jgi:hypothetical protein
MVSLSSHGILTKVCDCSTVSIASKAIIVQNFHSRFFFILTMKLQHVAFLVAGLLPGVSIRNSRMTEAVLTSHLCTRHSGLVLLSKGMEWLCLSGRLRSLREVL